MATAAETQWTNPIKAQLAPYIYRLTATLPLLYIEAKSLIELVQERPEFRQPLLWIPCLDGPSQDIGSLAWMQHHSLTENLPWLFVPAMLSASMYASVLIKEKFSLPDDTDPDSKIKPIYVDYAMPLLAGGAALVSPAAVSLNWSIAQLLSMIQFFLVKEKLKKFDDLDMDAIREKDIELKNLFNSGQSIVRPELQFDFDETNGDIKVKDEPVYVLNETQRNFKAHYQE